MKLIKQHDCENMIWTLQSQPDEHGFNGQNFLMEWDDNSIGYGGNSVINKLIKDSNGRWSVIRGQQGGSCTDERFIYGFIDKKKRNNEERNRSESSGLAEMGGSVSTHNFSTNDVVGYVTPDRKFRIAKFEYGFLRELKTSEATPSDFKKLQSLHVSIYEVSKEEYLNEHGLGKSFNGWFNKSTLFKGTRLRPDFYKLVDFSSMRYQFRPGKKLKYELHVEGEEPISLPTKRFYFPCKSAEPVTHYSQMLEVEDTAGETLHTIGCGSDVYEGTLHSYETIRASQTDKLMKLESMAGGQHMIHPTHFKKLDFPTIDVIDASGTYITTVPLFTKSRWDEFYNNRKWFFVLTSDSAVPFARMKNQFSNESFPLELRAYVKSLAKKLDLGHTGSKKMLKKIEDAEVQNYVDCLRDENNPSHPTVLLNTENIIGGKIELNDITTECTGYEFNTDLIFNSNHEHLIEWQKDRMDDEHITEFIARLVMPRHEFKTLTWVHGSESSNLVNKLKKVIEGGRVNLAGIEKIQTANKKDFFTTKGYQNATLIYQK